MRSCTSTNLLYSVKRNFSENRIHGGGHLRQVSWDLQLAVLSLGITSIIAQIVLLREFLSVFYGNELVIGIILANWMVLTGLGAYGGRYLSRIRLKAWLVLDSLILLGILPFLTVFLLRCLRNIVFTAGGMIDISRIISSSFVLLAPYCLVGGALFTVFAHVFSERYGTNLISGIYSWEAMGSLIGGLVFNFVMIYFLTSFQILKLIFLFNCAVGFLLALRGGLRGALYAIPLLFTAMIVLTSVFDVDALTKRLLFRGQEILSYSDTPYGSITITEQGGQRNFFEDNVLLFSTNDPTLNEEAVHYALVQRTAPRKVLLVGGGLSGLTSEALKYGPDRVDYVEINPWLVEVGRRFSTALDDPRIRVISDDARRYARMTDQRYDAVLINVSDPVTAQFNRYYTADFFRELRRITVPGAVISLSLLENVDYYGAEARAVTSVMYGTLMSCFRNVLIVPGTTRNYLLASDDSLSIAVARLIGERAIPTVFVNRYYIDDDLLRDRSRGITAGLTERPPLNEDFRPVAYYRQVQYWLSYFKFNYWIPVGAMVAILLLALWRTTAVSFGMFTGGFAASSLEVVLLIAFQVIYGYVYHMTGLIITVFMAGLATGSLNREKLFRENHIGNYIRVQLIVGAYSLVVPFVLLRMRHADFSPLGVHAVFVALTFFLAVLIGAQFSLATAIQGKSVAAVASGVYGIDLMGSALGALAVTVYLVPLVGIVTVCFIIGGVSLMGALVSFIHRTRLPDGTGGKGVSYV